MKNPLPIFLLSVLVCITMQARAQLKYPYRYRVETKKLIDTGNILIQTKMTPNNSISLNGLFLNSKKDTLPFIAIEVKNEKYTKRIEADEYGKFRLNLPQGKYRVSLDGHGIIVIDSVLVLNSDLITGLKYGIDRVEPNAFIIHSKHKMNRKQIAEIRKCVEKNEGFKDCNRKESFWLGIEI